MLESNIEIKEAFRIGRVLSGNWEFEGIFGYENVAFIKFI
jgi:hypothetical protein